MDGIDVVNLKSEQRKKWCDIYTISVFIANKQANAKLSLNGCLSFRAFFKLTMIESHSHIFEEDAVSHYQYPEEPYELDLWMHEHLYVGSIPCSSLCCPTIHYSITNQILPLLHGPFFTKSNHKILFYCLVYLNLTQLAYFTNWKVWHPQPTKQNQWFLDYGQPELRFHWKELPQGGTSSGNVRFSRGWS